MAAIRNHLNDILDVTPSRLGRLECLKTGDVWVQLRLCGSCGHVRYSTVPNRRATKHFRATGRPIIEGISARRMGLIATSTKWRSIYRSVWLQHNGSFPRFLLKKSLCANFCLSDARFFGSKAEQRGTVLRNFLTKWPDRGHITPAFGPVINLIGRIANIDRLRKKCLGTALQMPSLSVRVTVGGNHDDRDFGSNRLSLG